jgi:hypothetical protein
VLYYFKSTKQLFYSQPYLYNRKKKDESKGRKENQGCNKNKGRASKFDYSSSHHSLLSQVNKSYSKELRKADKDKCKVCYQKGHYQRDCPLLKQIWLNSAKKKDHSQALQTKKARNITIAKEFNSDLIYTSPERAILITTSLT